MKPHQVRAESFHAGGQTW